jgi:hypothetical protein
MSNQWEYIRIDHANTLYNFRSKLLSFDCSFCGIPERGYYTVTRKSLFSGNVYTDYCCEVCKDKWLPSSDIDT